MAVLDWGRLFCHIDAGLATPDQWIAFILHHTFDFHSYFIILHHTFI